MNNYAAYTHIGDVPLERRTHKGARLSVVQINTLCRRAYELGVTAKIPDSVRTAQGGEIVYRDGQPVTLELGEEYTVFGGEAHSDNNEAALLEFEKTHEIVGELWVSKKERGN